MITIADAEDALLHGEAAMREFVKEFEDRWYKPLGRTLIGTLIDRLPDNMKAMMEVNNDRLPGR